MRRILFSPDDLQAIRHERYHHPHPRVQRKMEVLWLKNRGFTHADIGDVADLSRRSVQRVLDQFLEGGLARVRQVSWQGKTADLAPHQASLEDHFLSHPPASARAAQAVIEEQTGLRRGLTCVRAFLKKLSASAGARSGPSRPRPTPTRKRRF